MAGAGRHRPLGPGGGVGERDYEVYEDRSHTPSTRKGYGGFQRLRLMPPTLIIKIQVVRFLRFEGYMDCRLVRFIRLEKLEGSKMKVRRVRRLEGLLFIRS